MVQMCMPKIKGIINVHIVLKYFYYLFFLCLLKDAIYKSIQYIFFLKYIYNLFLGIYNFLNMFYNLLFMVYLYHLNCICMI